MWQIEAGLEADIYLKKNVRAAYFFIQWTVMSITFISCNEIQGTVANYIKLF